IALATALTVTPAQAPSASSIMAAEQLPLIDRHYTDEEPSSFRSWPSTAQTPRTGGQDETTVGVSLRPIRLACQAQQGGGAGKVGRSRRRPNSDIQRPDRGIRFAVDSPLEGDGFELPVPRKLGLHRGRRLALHLGSLRLR